MVERFNLPSGSRLAASAFVLAIGAVAGCQAYDRGLYGSLTSDGGNDVSADRVAPHDASPESGADALDAGADVFDAVTTLDGDDASPPDVPMTIDVQPDDVMSDASDTVTPCEAGLGANQIDNPGFESGFPPWVSYVAPGAVAAIGLGMVSPHSGLNCAEANVTTAGANEYDIQMAHGSVSIHAGRGVHIELWVRASAPRDFSVVLQQNTTPYTNYCYWSQLVGTDWTLVSGDCVPSSTDPYAAIALNLSAAAGVVDIDDVSFSELTVCP